jgi:hypothetical protein
MATKQVELFGITPNQIQEIFHNTLKDFKQAKTRIIYLDASYLYTFQLADYPEIRKLNLLTRYNHSLAIEWHRLLERWYQDQTVVINNRNIKPIKISRTFDRVVNEGLEMIAAAIVGGSGSSNIFNFRAIGDGTIDAASPSDTALVHEIDRINVDDNPEGGSLSRDGSTIYSIGNHSVDVPTPANGEFTEVGMFDSEDTNNDRILDHSVFEDPIPHTQHADAPGSTTVIYMCSV